VVEEQVDAKAKLGRDAALKLAGAVSRVTIAKGKKVVTFSMDDDRPDDDTLLAHLLGPTGNLRAPVVRAGSALLVGFNQDTYEAAL
jgi:hypothetical protein